VRHAVGEVAGDEEDFLVVEVVMEDDGFGCLEEDGLMLSAFTAADEEVEDLAVVLVGGTYSCGETVPSSCRCCCCCRCGRPGLRVKLNMFKIPSKGLLLFLLLLSLFVMSSLQLLLPDAPMDISEYCLLICVCCIGRTTLWVLLLLHVSSALD